MDSVTVGAHIRNVEKSAMNIANSEGALICAGAVGVFSDLNAYRNAESCTAASPSDLRLIPDEWLRRQIWKKKAIHKPPRSNLRNLKAGAHDTCTIGRIDAQPDVRN